MSMAVQSVSNTKSSKPIFTADKITWHAPIFSNHNGFHHWFADLRWIWLNHGHGRSGSTILESCHKTINILGTLKLWHESTKLALKPFTIIKVLNSFNYHLSLSENWHIYSIFHASLPSPFKHTEIHGENFIRPLPDLRRTTRIWNRSNYFLLVEKEKLILSNGRDILQAKTLGN